MGKLKSSQVSLKRNGTITRAVVIQENEQNRSIQTFRPGMAFESMIPVLVLKDQHNTRLKANGTKFLALIFSKIVISEHCDV
jgi:hypothetical protein